MKKMTLTLILSTLFSASLFAPEFFGVNIIQGAPINPFKHVIDAVVMVESKGDTMAYNVKEEATGAFQIRPIRLNAYNEATGSHYKMSDMYNYEISEKIFLFYACQYGPYRMDELIMAWNGSGPMTYNYLKNVKLFL